jgi:hypothetical protein
MKKMRMNAYAFVAIAVGLLVTSCDNNDEVANQQKGKLEVSIADSPIDAANVEAVVISVNSVEVNGPNGWEEIISFDTPEQINLLDYQGGESFVLGEAELVAGSYSQVRLNLEVQQQGGQLISNPGCFIRFTDGSTQALFVPSGGQRGFAVIGNFSIPSGGVTAVTIDFDVRKSVVRAGNSGLFVLKPTLRLLENNQAARITGTVSGYEGDDQLIVYAYAAGSFRDSETTPNLDGQVFRNAITSAAVNPTSGAYTLAFLMPGEFDLVIAEHNNEGDFIEILKIATGVSTSAGSITTFDLSLASEEEEEEE